MPACFIASKSRVICSLVIDPLSQSQNEPGRALTGGSTNAAGDSWSADRLGSGTLPAADSPPCKRPLGKTKAASRTAGSRRLANDHGIDWWNSMGIVLMKMSLF
jgi:hypothetical protein